MTMTALMTCIVFCRWTLSSCLIEQSVLTVTQNLVGLLRLAERLGTDLEPDWEICWGLDLRQAETVWSWDKPARIRVVYNSEDFNRSFVLLLFDEHGGVAACACLSNIRRFPGILEWWYLQIIHFKKSFHTNHPFWGTLILGNLHYLRKMRTHGIFIVYCSSCPTYFPHLRTSLGMISKCSLEILYVWV